MPLRKDTIADTAAMAKLEFSSVELDGFTVDLTRVYTYFDGIKNLKTILSETPAVVETANNIWREDEVKPSLIRAKVLANAPEKDEGFFRVPKVIG